MTNNEIKEITAILFSHQHNAKRINLEGYSVKELEEMSIYIYNNHGKYSPKDASDVLDDILHERKLKIDASFVWSEENKQKFLRVNNELIRVWQSAYNEAIALAQKLEYRMCNEDSFIKDYEIELKITPYVREEDTTLDDDSFTYVLCEPLNGYPPLSCGISYDEKDLPIFLDKSLNWNIDWKLKDIFTDDVYIGYSIHRLIMDDVWSLYDITNIDRIWANVEILHQYFTYI